MPILTITLKGDELKKKTINLHDPLNLRYFKLLHVNHNLVSTDINAAKRTLNTGNGAVSGATDNLALLFAQVSFLTSKDVNFYESLADGSGFSHNVFSVGETTDDAKKVDFKEYLCYRFFPRGFGVSGFCTIFRTDPRRCFPHLRFLTSAKSCVG